MQIPGYAFDPNSVEIQRKYSKRLSELSGIDGVELRRRPNYGKTDFSGTLATDSAKKLSELDIALIADRGNLCFGGECTITGDTFKGSFYTD